MSFVPRSRYRPVVRLGNWFEDICLAEDKMRAFGDLRERGGLLVEKTRELFEHFHKDVSLSAPKENVNFGAIVQLLPLGMDDCKLVGADFHPALSIIINERVVRYCQRINDECELTIAPAVKSCVRNSFRIVSVNDEVFENELLKYGQPFRLECMEKCDGEPLLLFSSQKSWDLTSMIRTSYDSRSYGEINLSLGLCKKKNCGPGKLIPGAYTNWYCQHMNPHERFETHLTPLPSNEPLVITHQATNRNLAAENVLIQTLFGPEFLVSVQNYKNTFKRETWKNIWMISNGHQVK